MPRVEVIPTSKIAPATLTEIRVLLDDAFAGDFDDDDWAHTLGGRHAIVREDDRIVAHAAVVDRVLHAGDRPFRTGYVEGVATAPDRQHRGLGTMAMTPIGAAIRRHFELGALGTGEWAFYEQLGWERWQGPTFVVTTAGIRRTEDDDDGVMVLRFGPSAGLDRTTPLRCEERPGDVW